MILLALLLLSTTAATVAVTALSPNIVLVISDDLGHADVGYNNAVIHSPFLDTLSSSSRAIRLTQYYAHPTCTPSRAALFTGRFSHNTGLPFPLIGTPAAGLSTTIPVLPELLKERNYATHLIGKWHLGHAQEKMTPIKRGFDTFFGLYGGGFNHYTKDVGACIDLHNGNTQVTKVNTKKHATAEFADAAVALIDSYSEQKPLFLVVSFTAAHDPLFAEEEDIQACSKTVISHRRKMFCALVSGIDRSVSRIVSTLKKKNIWDNTIFIWTSDNGGLPYAGGFNYPFRGIKSSAWEGALRVPAFIVAPPQYIGESTSPRVYNGIFHIADWAPTILGFVEQATPCSSSNENGESAVCSNRPSLKFDGIDQGPNLKKGEASVATTKDRLVILQHDIFMNVSSVRKGDYKLILGSPGVPWVFFEPPEGSNIRHHVEGPCTYRFLTFQIAEFIADSWEENFGFLPIIFTVLGYVISMERFVIADYMCSSSYRNFLQDDSKQMKSLTSPCLAPSLEWSQEQGPRIFLYNLTADPYESNNLAFSKRDIVESLHKELVESLKTSPTQFAGDAIDSAAPKDGPCHSWIPDSATDLSNYPTVTKRFFVSMQSKLQILIIIVFVVISLLLMTFLSFILFLARRLLRCC